jgi:hypothetical protein
VDDIDASSNEILDHFGQGTIEREVNLGSASPLFNDIRE